jgi:hypothetical protein
MRCEKYQLPDLQSCDSLVTLMSSGDIASLDL